MLLDVPLEVALNYVQDRNLFIQTMDTAAGLIKSLDVQG